MCFYLWYISYFMMVFFGMANYTFAIRDFDLNKLPSQEPTNLESIIEIFINQFTPGLEKSNQWNELRENPNDTKWNNLCYQSWHNRDRENFSDFECEAEFVSRHNSPYWVFVQNIEKLKPDLLKCLCSMGNKRTRVTNHDYNFFLVHHNDTEYFSLLYMNSFHLIIHGFVTDLHSPFNTTLGADKKYYFTEEAIRSYTESAAADLSDSLNSQKIRKIFTTQYKNGTTTANKWNALRQDPKATYWNDLCYQAWHKRDDPDFSHMKCTARYVTNRPMSSLRVDVGRRNLSKLRVDVLKCRCSDFSNYINITDNNHNFGLIRHTDTNYFSAIYMEPFVLNIHGYVTNLQYPFNTTLSPDNRHYFTDEANRFYYATRRH